MKPKKILVLLYLAAMLFLYNCNVDKLELVNPNQLTTETYFKTEAQVQQAVNAVYAIMQTHGLYQRTFYFAMDNMAYEQVMNPASEADKRQYSNFTFDANHGAIRDYWKNCYAGITRANFVITNEETINKIPAIFMSQVMKNKYIGEAQFLRALYYFHLVTRFGDVPLYLEFPDEGKGLARTSKAEIWAQIETDLNSAAEKCLPKIIEEKGRATSGAAWALLGKAHLFQANASNDQADYIAAKNAFLHVINDVENYDLEDIYADNFKEETEHGTESIFEVEFNPELGTNDIWSSDGSGLNEGTFRAMEYGCFNWYNVTPIRDLVEEFETLADNGIKADPRLGYCIYQTGDLYNNGADTVVINNIIFEYWEDGVYKTEVWYRYGWRKYQNYYKQKYENYSSYSGINTKVIRLADVLLMMAEVENELDKIPEAIGYLNQVRNRADVMMPNYGTPAMDAIYPVSNKEQLRIVIEHERKIELCNEQVRFNDLVRWRRLEAFITDEVIPGLTSFHKSSIKFDPAKHYLWPIPQDEIDSNPGISKYDQNYGY